MSFFVVLWIIYGLEISLNFTKGNITEINCRFLFNKLKLNDIGLVLHTESKDDKVNKSLKDINKEINK